jgi:hypothetical protein
MTKKLTINSFGEPHAEFMRGSLRRITSMADVATKI